MYTMYVYMVIGCTGYCVFSDRKKCDSGIGGINGNIGADTILQENQIVVLHADRGRIGIVPMQTRPK